MVIATINFGDKNSEWRKRLKTVAFRGVISVSRF